MPESFSKPIRKTDESSKELIIETLEGKDTHGFDLESVYFVPSLGGWIVIEFLKCDTVRPFDSHPRRYWYKNWRKFSSLWAITRKLEGSLFLVNYEKSRAQFSIIKVIRMKVGEAGGILEENRQNGDFQFFKAWFQELNSRAEGAWLYLGSEV